ncbi:MAG TPA: 3-isopropylmalate dehydrogenase, partial [Pirellulales bacterium]|nr:3-isopropylmalate dehydrogenase [Pirellulales bacterium]
MKIAVIGGDGTGPEVAAEGLKVLEAIAALEKFKYELTPFDFGGDRYLRTGEILPTGAVDELRTFDAIYLGAVGHPDVPPGVLEKGLLLELRFQLDQYINLRPVQLFPGVETPLTGKGPDDINFVVVRENTEDLYCGVGGFLKKNTPDEVASQTAVYTRKGCERCIRWAFEFTRRRNNPKKMLTLVAKTNVLTYGHDLWWRTFQDVAREYPDIKADYNHVDACCMWMVKNPEYYDVIVTTNMFGDIITDLGAAIQGGMGMAASGNINPTRKTASMFEPVHGSAPDIAGKNLANPIATFLSIAMMLEFLDQRPAGNAIKQACAAVVADKKNHTRDLGGILQGGMGVEAGANLNPDPGGTSMFEPMGGSAPKYTGQHVINPIAAINAMAMLLEHTGQPRAGKRMIEAIKTVTG